MTKGDETKARLRLDLDEMRDERDAERIEASAMRRRMERIEDVIKSQGIEIPDSREDFEPPGGVILKARTRDYEVELLRSTLGQQAIQIREQAAEIEKLRTEISEQIDEINDLRKSFNSQVLVIAGLKTEIAERDEMIDGMAEDFSQQAKKVERLESAAEKGVGQLMHDLTATDATISSLMEQRGKLNDLARERGEEIAEHEVETRSLRGQIHALKTAVDGMTRDLAEAGLATIAGETDDEEEDRPGQADRRPDQEAEGIPRLLDRPTG